MDKQHQILAFVKRFLAGTLLSRVFGAARDVVMAFCFASAPEVSSFMVAYRLSNLFRRLLGEGSLQSGFTPFYVALDEKKAAYFYRDLTASLFVVLFLLVTVCQFFLFLGSSILPESWQEIVVLINFMLPGVIFICLSALNSALLQAKNNFFSSSVAPALFNVIWIVFCFVAYPLKINEAMKLLALGICFAYFAQWLLTVVFTLKHVSLTRQELLSFRLLSDEVRKIIKPVLLGVLGIGASQINSASDAIFSRLADLEGPAYLWYSIRFQQLPIGLFAVALSSAILPVLAKAFADDDKNAYVELLRKGLRHAIAFMLPFTFLLIVLGPIGLNVLYGHGDFSKESLEQTSICLWGYCMGLVPATIVMLIVNGFYAKKSFYLPMVSSVISIVAHMILNTFLVFVCGFGAVSIAISTSISTLLNCALLIYFFYREYGIFVLQGLSLVFVKILSCSVFASFSTVACGYFLFSYTEVFSCFYERYLINQIVQLVILGFVFGFSLFMSCKFLQISDFFELFSSRKKSQKFSVVNL